jgi:hypothetical protein
MLVPDSRTKGGCLPVLASIARFSGIKTATKPLQLATNNVTGTTQESAVYLLKTAS